MPMRVWILTVALAGQAAAPPPDTEVFLATLSTRDGKVEIGKPINISNSAGYDNQPSFTPDGASLRLDARWFDGERRFCVALLAPC